MQRREEGVPACHSILWFYKGINIDGEWLEQRWSILVMSVIGRFTNDRWLSGTYGRMKSKNKNREPAKIKATARRNIYILKRLGLARGKFYQYHPYYLLLKHSILSCMLFMMMITICFKSRGGNFSAWYQGVKISYYVWNIYKIRYYSTFSW